MCGNETYFYQYKSFLKHSAPITYNKNINHPDMYTPSPHTHTFLAIGHIRNKGYRLMIIIFSNLCLQIHIINNHFVCRFHDKILNTAYYDNTLYVITVDQNTKNSLETALSYQNVSHEITVKDKLPISPLSKIGVPLHGAKFVLVDEGVEAFHSNKTYATTGSLMKVSNNNMMVAVTCRHAVEKEGSAANTFYVLYYNREFSGEAWANTSTDERSNGESA